MNSKIDDLLPTRQSLLGRLKDWGDREGWQDFFNTYWKLIYSVALKAGLGDAEAQDIVQETMIGVAKAISEFQYNPKTGSFKGWLLTITRRRIADHFRRKYTQPAAGFQSEFEVDSSTPLLSRIPDDDPSWESVWEEEWERNLLDVALENVKHKVKSRQYQLFDCFVLKQWPMSEVREKLGVSMAQVYFAKYKVTGLVHLELRKLKLCSEGGHLACK
jgi:RNA polymerase sigma-70 factor (ECF subfamily)